MKCPSCGHATKNILGPDESVTSPPTCPECGATRDGRKNVTGPDESILG